MNSFDKYETKPPAELFGLKGRTILILGGSSGIGLGMAAGLGLAGAEVILNGRGEEKLAKAEAWLKGKNVEVRTFAGSAADRDFKANLDALFEGESLHLDGVVFSAATFHLQPFLSYDAAKRDEILHVNLKAPLEIAQWAANRMKERGGSLLFVSSGAALRAMPQNAVYAATKGALRSLTKTLAVELARFKIRVNALIPGWVDTPMVEFTKAPDPKHPDKPLPFESIRKSIPLKRWGLPSDFAGIGVWLMSDASGYVTGQEFVVDGGMIVN